MMADKGTPVPKDKQKKHKDGKQPKKQSKKGGSGKAAKSLKAISANPLVADVVAAALVAMASALKDSDKARRLASDAGDQLNALSKKNAAKGNAMWDLALNIGRNTLDTLADELRSNAAGKKAKPR